MAPSQQMNSIRRKTAIKLEKFIKENGNTSSSAKAVAVGLEEKIAGFDESTGKKYKKIAYQVLSALRVLYSVSRAVKSQSSRCLISWRRDFIQRGVKMIGDSRSSSLNLQNCSFLWTYFCQSAGESITFPIKLNAI